MIRSLAGIVIWLFAAAAAFAAATSVADLEALQKAVETAKPGDKIVVKNGSYSSSGTITVACEGTADNPIVIEAESVGGVEIKGDGGFRLEVPAAYVVVKGFNFTHRQALTLNGGVHHCRITRNTFELPVGNRGTYLSVSGNDNEIDYNEFKNKNTEGQMVYIQGPGGDRMAERSWIHHNYFHDFRNSRRNNSSALHIGSSWRSMTPTYSVVEFNLFERTEGENEGGICNKSTDNIYRFNTMGEGSSELSLRHGKRILVYGNYLIGGTGIRFYSHDHRIFSNYFENCRIAMNIGNGGATIPPGPLVSHEKPERVDIVYNTFVNNRGNIQMSGRRNGLGSDSITVANNIVMGGNQAVSISGSFTNPKWEGNILWNNEGGAGDIPAEGFTNIDPQLKQDEHGIYKLQPGSPAIGKGAGSFDYVNLDVDGQPRAATKDIGADQLADAPGVNRPLKPADVGPNAPEEAGRPLISAPANADFIKQ